MKTLASSYASSADLEGLKRAWRRLGIGIRFSGEQSRIINQTAVSVVSSPASQTQTARRSGALSRPVAVGKFHSAPAPCARVLLQQYSVALSLVDKLKHRFVRPLDSISCDGNRELPSRRRGCYYVIKTVGDTLLK